MTELRTNHQNPSPENKPSQHQGGGQVNVSAFMAAFHVAGATVNGIPPTDNDSILFPAAASVSSGDMKGLYIGVKNSKSPPDSAKQLQLLLADAGYRAKFTNWAHLTDTQFVFVVSY
jgi:hypothetical protein